MRATRRLDHAWRLRLYNVASQSFGITQCLFARPARQIEPPTGRRRAERYRRIGLAETDAARAKILWQLMTDAQRNLLCTPDTSRALRGHALMAPDGKGPDSGTEIRGPPKGMP